MKRPLIALFLSAFVAFSTFMATGESQEQARRGFLSVLTAGQSVTLRENAGRFEIMVMENMRLGHRVTEVGTDYVVVEDAAGVTETRIPVYSIKAIVKIKVPGR